MAVDLGRLLRIRGAIEATIESASRGGGQQSPFAGKPFAEAYARYRGELLEVLKDHPDLSAELEKMCPPLVPGSSHRNTDLFGQEAYTRMTGAVLGQLKGWIQGLVDEAEMQANAEAYAAAKLKEERGVGFKP